MADDASMSNEQLASYLAEMERQAVSFRQSDLADDQETAIDFYEAKPFGDEVDGRSQVVVPVVQEVVDYMTVSVLRTFVSGDKVVEFEAKEEDTAPAVDEATEAVNHVFMREQDGYKVLHDWLKCGLIERICAVETMCVEDEKRTRRTITLTPEEVALAMEAGEEPIRATDNEDGTIACTFEEVRKRKRYVDMPLPNWEFLFSPRTRHEDDSEYLCHRTKKTQSDLIEMGFDRDLVESLTGTDEVSDLDGRASATWENEEEGDTDRIPGLKKLLLRKEYARIDFDGDGIAELLRVYRVGGTILEAEEVDEQPFTVFTPFPRPHRMVGNSLADKVMDIQRNKSVVLRQNFDAFYMENQPRWWVPQESTTETTIDDLLTQGPGVLVRGRGAPPVPLIGSFDPTKGMAVLEYLSGEQESRTGITRLNQGLDAEAMNKTATGMALQSSQGQQIEEFVARNFAEALARLMLKKLRLMIEHGDPIAMRVGGEYRVADPSAWTDDVGVNIRVGLGSGKKEARLNYRMQIAGLQAEAYATGTGLVDDRRLYNSAAGIVRDAGLGDPNDFFVDPSSPDFKKPEPAPDPAAAKIEADKQATAAKLQLDAQKSSAELQQKETEGALKLQLMREEAAAKLELEREKSANEMQLARERMVAEIALEQERMRIEAEQNERNAQRQHEAAMKQADTKIKGNRPGGSLAE